MKNLNKVLVLFLLLMLMANSSTPIYADAAAYPAGYQAPFETSGGTSENQRNVEVVGDNANGFRLTVRVPWQDLKLNEVTIGGAVFSEVRLADWVETSKPGTPKLPFITKQLGAPAGAEISLKVTPGKSHEYALSSPVLPSARKEAVPPALGASVEGLSNPELLTITEADPEIYNSEGYYPTQLASISADGFMRQQRVVGISIFPVQYNPSRKVIIVYETIDVEITFLGNYSGSAKQKRSESVVYEQLFKNTLLNYETAKQWRVEPADQPAVAGISTKPNMTAPWTPPNPGWRVSTAAEGLYKLTYAELESAGLPVSNLDPRTFQLFNFGAEVAIRVEGEDDGAFDESDFILFYAEAVNTKYTGENVYWLTYGSTQGARMSTLDGTPTVSDGPISFQRRKHIENNLFYIYQTPGDDRLDRWMGEVLNGAGNPVTYSINLVSPTTGQAKIKFSVMGYNDNSHQIQVKVNNVSVGSFQFAGRTYQTFETDVSGELLIPGQNKVEFRDSMSGSLVIIDWIELSYQSGFSAEQGQLKFEQSTPGTQKFHVDRFPTGSILVFDVSEPNEVKQIEGGEISETGGFFEVAFQDEIESSKTYFLAENSTIKTVKSIELDEASDLSSSANAADYIVITPKAFKSQADTLSAYRSGQGLRTKVVQLHDIYDEFGFGLQDVDYIRDFLSFAYHNWQSPAPAYVVLFGDGNQDPRRYVSASLPNYIPAYLAAADPWYIETAADNRYVTFVGNDTLPDMMLGRLTADNVTEANILVNKVINYEATPANAWKQNVLFVADNADLAGDFDQISDDLIGCCLPDIFNPQKVYFKVNFQTVESTRAAIIGGFNDGALIVNYIGHASKTQWMDEGVFRVSDVNSLGNQEKLAVVLSMTCLDGQYQHNLSGANNRPMAELLTVTAGKGAVATWSPTGLGVSSGHDYLNRGFFDAVFTDGARTVGEGTAAGKLRLWSTGNHLDLLDTYLLFGDPALRLPVVYRPIVSSIPDQTVYVGQSFSKINLDEYVVDFDNEDAELSWTFYGNVDLAVEIVDRQAFITPINAGWAGTEAITFRATDPDGYYAETTVHFSVVARPFVNWLPLIIN